MPMIRGYQVSAYTASRELEDGRIFVIEYTTASTDGNYFEPPESDSSEPTFFIDGVQVEDKPEEITEEILQSMMEDSMDITSTYDFGGPDLEDL